MKISRMIQRCLIGLLAEAMLLCMIPAAIVRADASLSISVSGNIEVGSTITVKIIASGNGPYSGFDGSLSYDSNILELTGISQGDYTGSTFAANGPNFADYNVNIPDSAVLVSATFKCLAAGTASISCSLNDMADINGTPIAASGASKDIAITAPIPKSANADLASLAISPGTLSPAFSAATQSYTASVSANQSKITVSASPADAKSKVSLNGVQDKLVAGSNNVKITVTAENGATKVYTIAVTRSAGPTPTPKPTPIPLPLMKYNGADYTILAAGTADAIPEGYAAATAKYQGVDIPVLQKTLGEAVDASVMTIVLLTADSKTAYFVYDAVTETCYPYQLLSSTAMSFQILDKSAVTAIPEGYEAFDLVYLESTVTAYCLISDPANPQVLLYLMDGIGVSAFYYYDTQNGMLLLYRGAVSILVPTPTPTPTPAATATPAVTKAALPTVTAGLPAASAGRISFHSLLDYTNPVVLLVYLIALFCLMLLIICIVLIARKDKSGYMEAFVDDSVDNQEPIDMITPAPVVSPTPKEYFNEYGQLKAEKELFFGDAPHAEKAKLDFPVIPQRTAADKFVFPAAVKPGIHNIDSNELKNAPDASPFIAESDKQIIRRIPVQPVQSVQPTEHVPVRLQHELDAGHAQKYTAPAPAQPPVSKPKTNDPDFDPDDE